MTFEFTIKTGDKRLPKRMKVNLTQVQRDSAGPHRPNGYSKGHLSRVFGGKTQPSMECLVAIAVSLGLTLDETVDRLKRKRFDVRKQN